MLSRGDLGPHVGQLVRTKVNVAMTADPTAVAANVDAAAAARLMLDRACASAARSSTVKR